jgi:predicted nucleotidyltransferase
MDKDKIIKEIIKIIRQYLSKEYKILLFGSWAKNDALKTSDIDIAILGKEKAPWSLMTKILQEKEEIRTLRSIDIVDLNSVDDNFKNKILEHAQSLA